MLDISRLSLLYSHYDTNLYNLRFTFRSHSVNWLVFLMWCKIIISLLHIFMFMIIMTITTLPIEYSWIINPYVVLVFVRLLFVARFSRTPIIIITITRCRIHSWSWVSKIFRIYYFFRGSSIFRDITVLIGGFSEHRTTQL